MNDLLDFLDHALKARKALLSDNFEGAVRLFNGFIEGFPGLVVDLYARTLVIYNHTDNPGQLKPDIPNIIGLYRNQLPELNTILLKTRKAASQEERRGVLIYGAAPDRRLREHGVWYALDLQVNQDAGFYLDTRNLRLWELQNLTGKSVLNTFAYTGSLGVAALAGGARRVVQLDSSSNFLRTAEESYKVNGFEINPGDFRIGDFWEQVNRLKREALLFDCVILDPPFFSTSKKGVVDLIHQNKRLINKVRPLISHEGYLMAVNNALFVSGDEYMKVLDDLCESGYLSVEALIPVPEDVTGFSHTRLRSTPTDPTPFNHPTKIAVLRNLRKDRRTV